MININVMILHASFFLLKIRIVNAYADYVLCSFRPLFLKYLILLTYNKVKHFFFDENIPLTLFNITKAINLFFFVSLNENIALMLCVLFKILIDVNKYK